jgi:fumarylacetoacetase
MNLDETHDSARSSWVNSANGHADFPIQNLPLGIFSDAASGARPGVAIGDSILDLKAVAGLGLLPGHMAATLDGPTLNAALAAPAGERVALRRRLSQLLSDTAYRAQLSPFLNDAADCRLHLPAAIGDYTDFYAGIHHAENIGRLFRPNSPLLPNYKYVPIGYHGRASSIRPSGAPVTRPNGQRKPPNEDMPSYGPSRRLDYELELGVWIGTGNGLGRPIPIAAANAHIAGLCLLNDWSARDLQAWEYQPLGPFLAKSFHTTISPWIVTAEALAPFRIAQPARPDGDPRPLDYLLHEDDQRSGAFNLDLTVAVRSARMREAGMPPFRLSSAAASNLYWTVAQLVAHHTSNGCDLRPGDVLGTGTISAADPGGYGSLIELSRGGTEKITLPTGEVRTFLEDGDEVLLSATAHADGFVPIGFGPCRGEVHPAAQLQLP